MPCNSDYLEANNREKELRLAAQLLCYVMVKLDVQVPSWLDAAANDYYCKDDRAVSALCHVLKSMATPELESIVYNAHDKTARTLADWWDKHQAADCARLAKEIA